MAKVSIIMPSLNVGLYIEEAINSARNQTLSDIEIICIDAGSTDGTWEVISKAAEEDARIIALKSPIKSYGFQVNMGMDRASGKFIAILETDDYVSNEMYEKLYNVANEKELDFVKCNYCTYTTEKNGERRFIERKISENIRFYQNSFKPSLYPETVIDDWYLWNGIYRTDFLTENGIRFSETHGAAFQDIGFLHKVAVAAQKGIFINDSFYRYCVDREGASSNSSRTLKFIRKEYGILEDSLSEKSDGYSRRLLYLRMAGSFVRACKDSSDEVLDQRESNEICIWFQRKLREAERWGYLNEKDIPKGLYGAYVHLINPAKGFKAYRTVRKNEIQSFLEGNEHIIIFGCGIYGKEALRYLNKVGLRAYCFMDNSDALWGQEINTVKILNPACIKEVPENVKFIIANEKYAEEIKRQILSFRDNAKIFIYTSELVYTEFYNKNS